MQLVSGIIQRRTPPLRTLKDGAKNAGIVKLQTDLRRAIFFIALPATY